MPHRIYSSHTKPHGARSQLTRLEILNGRLERQSAKQIPQAIAVIYILIVKAFREQLVFSESNFPRLLHGRSLIWVRSSSRKMKSFAKAVDAGGHSRKELALSLAFLVLFASPDVVQNTPKSMAARAAQVQAIDTKRQVAIFTDITSELGLHFEYVASHTSRKYLKIWALWN